MQIFWAKNKYQIISGTIILIIIGFYFSRAAISIGTGFLGFISLVSIKKESIKKLFKPQNLIFLFTYFLFLISFFNTEDFSVYRQLIFLQLPFLLFPIVFSQIKIPKKQIHLILMFFILLTCLVCLATLISFFFNYQLNQDRIINGKAMPAITGIPHYQFALLIVIAIIVCFVALKDLKGIEKKTGIGLMFFLILTLHLLAYRTGLFCFYILLIYYISKQIFIGKNIKKNLLISALVILTIFLCAVYIKPLNLKIQATSKDISRILNHENYNDYSIAQRYAATLNSIEIIKRNFWIGVAPADLGAEMKAQYDIEPYLLMPYNRVPLHNQYLYYLSSFGIFAFLIWIFLWFKNLFQTSTKDIYILILASSAFLIDNFFQIQIGFTGILMFYYLVQQSETNHDF